MSDIHISKLTAHLTGPTKKAALKYCELYKCSTVRELYVALQSARRPAGIGKPTRQRLITAVWGELVLAAIWGGDWAKQHALAVVASIPESEVQA